MANYRAIAFDPTLPRIDTEIADTDTLLVGNIAPATGSLTIGSDVLATNYDFGTAVNRLGDIYCNNLNANNIIGPINTDGTNANVWAVNQDAVPAVAENVGVMWEATDGVTTLHNWRQLTVTSGREFHVQYKTNPTDPKDLSEGGYTTAIGYDGPTNVTTVYGNLDASSGIDVLAGNLTLPATSGAGNGVVELGGTRFLHAYNNNLFLGRNSGNFTTSAGDILGVGSNTFNSVTGPTSRCVAVGNYALENMTAAGFNTAVGYYALNSTTTGQRNTALGTGAGSTQQTANDTIAIGFNTLDALNTANGIIAIGSEAFGAATSAEYGVAIGYGAAAQTTNGDANTVVGYEALYSNTQGHDNIVLGYHALYTATNARDCIALGTDALQLNPGGTGNIAIGRAALQNNVSGTENTVVGYRAGSVGASGSNNVFIGFRAGQNEAGDDKLYISNSSTSTPLIYGDFSSSELTVNADVLQTSAEPFIINYDAAGGTAEIAGHVVAAGDGSGNIESWRTRLLGPTSALWFEHKTNPTDLTDLTEAGYTQFLSLNPAGPTINVQTDVLATGHDFGTAANRLGDVYCTTIDSTNFNSDGTNSNVWIVNEDAAAGTPEDTGIALPSADASDVENWQIVSDASAQDLHFKYKQNPTDPGDLSEPGYLLALVLAQNGAAQLAGSLGISGTSLLFSGGAGTVVTSGGNLNLTAGGSGDVNITAGGTTGDLVVTADNWNLASNGNVTTDGTEYDFTTNGIVEAQSGRLVLRASTFVQGDAPLVDLRTSVTALDVPSGTAFRIGGVALTTGNWTAPNVDTLLDGSNADALHTHAQTGGVDIYPPSATNPTTPPPSDGDMYYNTTFESWQYYDATRTKWLSITECVYSWGHDNADGNQLRGHGIINAGSGTGILIPRDCTVKRITARTRAGNATKQFDLLVNGSSVLSFSLAAGTYKNNSANTDLNEDDYVWVEASATGAASNDVAIIIWTSWRT